MDNTLTSPSTKSPAIAAIEYAVSHDSPVEFLKLWLEGDFASLRREWSDIPESVFTQEKARRYNWELTLEEEVDLYRKVLDEGATKICEAVGLEAEHYDRDQSDFACYEDCLNDAAELLKKSGLRYDSEGGLFTRADAIWLTMESAPKDGSMVRLLVNFEQNSTEDEDGPSPTIGFNNLANDGEDLWRFAGWNWEHDEFTQGAGDAVGWLPLICTTSESQKLLSAAIKLAERGHFNESQCADADTNAEIAEMRSAISGLCHNTEPLFRG